MSASVLERAPERRIHLRLGDPRNRILNGFMLSRAGVSVIRGPLGSGKTTGAICRIMQQMAEQPPDAEGVRRTRWLAIRNTYPDLTGTTIKDFREIFRDEICRMKYGGKEPPTAYVRFRCEDGTRVESEVIFLALDRPDAVKKLKGYQVTGIWLNEMKEIHPAIVYEADGRHGRFPSWAKHGVECGWHGILGDTNSWDEDHYLHEQSEEPPPDWDFYHQPGGVYKAGLQPNGRVRWELNPNAENLGGLKEDYYRRLVQGKTDDWIKVMVANEYGFVVEGVPVWMEYIDSFHCPEEPIAYREELPLCIGIDFGRTPAAAIAQHDTATARTDFIDEFCTRDFSAARFGKELRRYLGERYPKAEFEAWGDPAGDLDGDQVDDTPIQLLRAAGIPVQPSPVPGNAMLVRRAAAEHAFKRVAVDGRASIRISKRCRVLRRGAMGGFHYRKLRVSGEDRYTEKPEKNWYSHICEAVEYLLVALGEGVSELRRPFNPFERRQEFADT